MRRSILLSLFVAVSLGPGARLLAEGPPPHWAFAPIATPEPPSVRDESWPRGDVDRFVLARLEARGLAPSPEADRRALLRRAWMTLVGLWPPASEIDAFLADPRPDSFERRVDALLASPRYAERQARRWLDVARYADTKGYTDAGEVRYPFAWTYRDWVVEAFAEHMPFDRFVELQLAADLHPEARRGDLAALGFLTVGSRFNFFPDEILDDRIDVLSRGFLALTTACARCHDHKYDPIPQRDYYSLRAVFESSREPSPEALPPLGPSASAAPAAESSEGSEDSEDSEGDVAEAARVYHARRAELYDGMRRELRERAGDYLRYVVQTDEAHRTLAQPPLRNERGLIRARTAYGRGAVARFRALLRRRGPDDPLFGLWNRLHALERDEVGRRLPAVRAELRAAGLLNVLLDRALEGRTIRHLADLADVYGELLEDTEAMCRARREARAEKGNEGESGDGPTASPEAFSDPAREELRLALYGPDAPSSFTLDESEEFYHLDEHSDMRGKFAAIERALLAAERPRPRAMALVDRERPVQGRVLVRGDPSRPGDPVDRRFLSALASVRSEPFSERSSGRLELARAITAPSNPLTARVIVNRVWSWHFGAPLVETPSDFGRRSDGPSHPELLDWLAARLIEEGWSIQHLERRLLSSSAWRQSSRYREDGHAIDPANRLLWRANRRRLDFEAMRDSMLSVAGRLSVASGGRPVEVAPGDPDGTHRTIWGLVDREKVPPLLRTFDFPSPDLHAPTRPRTSVPQQALFLLNGAFPIALADVIGDDASVVEEQRGRRAAVAAMWRRVHGRAPADDEVALVIEFLRSGTHERPWSAVAQGLLTSNEFLFSD